MHYSPNLDMVIKNSLSELITSYQNHAIMFDNQRNYVYGTFYQKLKAKNVH